MTNTLKTALSLSLGIHAGLLSAWPTTTTVALDVERAPTSLDILLVAPRATPTVQPNPPLVEAPGLPEPEPVAQPIVTPESRGALSDVLPGYLRNPAPVYPFLARQRGEEGLVVLSAEVLPTGRCGQLSVLSSSGARLLDEAALKAVRRWQFKPATRGGHSVAVRVEIPVRFQLVERAD